MLVRLGDIVENIAKMNIFCSFSEGSLGRVFTKVGSKGPFHGFAHAQARMTVIVA